MMKFLFGASKNSKAVDGSAAGDGGSDAASESSHSLPDASERGAFALALIEEIRAQSTEGFSLQGAMAGGDEDDSSDYVKPLAEISPERKVFDREGTLVGDVSLAVMLLESAAPPMGTQGQNQGQSQRRENTKESTKATSARALRAKAANRPTNDGSPDSTNKRSGGNGNDTSPSSTASEGNGQRKEGLLHSLFARRPSAEPAKASGNRRSSDGGMRSAVDHLESLDDSVSGYDSDLIGASSGNSGAVTVQRNGNTITTVANGRKRSTSTVGFMSRKPSIAPNSDVATVVVGGLRVSDLFYVDTLRTPRPFLEIALDNQVMSTHADVEGTACGWEDEEFEFSISRSALSYKDLTFTLFYKARLYGDIKVGTVAMSLSSLDISPLDEVVTQFDCTGEDGGGQGSANSAGRQLPKRVTEAAKKALSEGHDPPSLHATVWLKGKDGGGGGGDYSDATF
jgi:hypothetical protein